MSILIKGMKMPKGCYYCPLVQHLSSACYANVRIDRDDWYRKRADGCPLVELPEKHGRLIDERVAYDKIAEQEGGYYMDMDGVDCGLGETPTVIEAEGDEE